MTSPSKSGQIQLLANPISGKIRPATINHEDAVVFVNWLQDQDVPIHEGIVPTAVQQGLDALTKSDLRWLCKAILQAGNAPSVDRMRKAILSRDVGDLR